MKAEASLPTTNKAKETHWLNNRPTQVVPTPQPPSTTHYRHETTGRRLLRTPNSCLAPTISPSSTNRAHPTHPSSQNTNQLINMPATQQIYPLTQEVIPAIVTTPMEGPP
eukprot:1148285-Pelagomonas_calceolata.AAC.1